MAIRFTKNQARELSQSAAGIEEVLYGLHNQEDIHLSDNDIEYVTEKAELILNTIRNARISSDNLD